MGRKTVDDKKELLSLFVEASKIKKLGGKEEAKKVAYAAIDSKSIE